MAEYQSMTINELLGNIKQGRYVLPAMQRNFVWPEEKICKLFESIMYIHLTLLHSEPTLVTL